MNSVFDPFNLLLLAIALVVFWRLRGVLGSRTGNERPPIDPFRKPGQPAPAETPSGTVIRLPREAAPDMPKPAAEPELPVWTGFASEGSDLAKSISTLAAADPNFTPKAFVEGAKLAYEMIVEAFAKGDKAALKDLLSREVYDGFAGAIDARSAAGQRIEQRFVGIDKANLAGVSLTGSRAEVAVSFVSQIISVTYGKDGSLIDGDPKQIRAISDHWTFERDIKSRDPNWKLSATQAPE
ncbi:MAG: Tim44 domain-containing protein [Rhizobiales bacterium]|nr:Tim44 domain-containing protein [Hyphomicrobiales bacterium]MBI3674631.1 Tim44 domain-containing protein [Hyphomicrobiales bacterium]